MCGNEEVCINLKVVIRYLRRGVIKLLNYGFVILEVWFRLEL